MRAWKPLEADGGGGLDEDAFETKFRIGLGKGNCME